MLVVAYLVFLVNAGDAVGINMLWVVQGIFFYGSRHRVKIITSIFSHSGGEAGGIMSIFLV